MSEVFDESESRIPLGTPADCERALAKFIRQIHKGTMDPKVGHSLIIGVGTLAKMMRESRAEGALDRLERLEAKRGEQPAQGNPQAH